MAGEKAYNDCYIGTGFFSSNPYRLRVVSPYGYQMTAFSSQRPNARSHATSVHQTIKLNASLNAEAQASIDAKEPSTNIWDTEELDSSMSNLAISNASTARAIDEKRRIEQRPSDAYPDEKRPLGDTSDRGRLSDARPGALPTKSSKFAGFKKVVGLKSADEKAAVRSEKAAVATKKTSTKSIAAARELRDAILVEEQGRWPDEEWRQIVAAYQEKVGMTRKIADLRARFPTQYLHLLRAGYFEPIPVAWANLASNPLKFSIEAAAGWRGITPSWRGYEDTAEERLYWVLNHREGSVGMSMKPDVVSAMNMARARMASAVAPPPEYYSSNDTCHLQHTSEGYSKQVMPAPFQPFDAPEVPTDDTMILLDVSGSMDFEPFRPNYDQYLITGYSKSTQPKNKGECAAYLNRCGADFSQMWPRPLFVALRMPWPIMTTSSEATSSPPFQVRPIILVSSITEISMRCGETSSSEEELVS